MFMYTLGKTHLSGKKKRLMHFGCSWKEILIVSTIGSLHARDAFHGVCAHFIVWFTVVESPLNLIACTAL
jgi:hypothetical protein